MRTRCIQRCIGIAVTERGRATRLRRVEAELPQPGNDVRLDGLLPSVSLFLSMTSLARLGRALLRRRLSRQRTLVAHELGSKRLFGGELVVCAASKPDSCDACLAAAGHRLHVIELQKRT